MVVHTKKALVLAVSVASAAVFSPIASAALMEEVIVTAQKREQSLQDVGVSVTAFSGDNIKELGFTDSTDIAGQTPGLNIGTPVGEGNNPSIVLRGVGLNDFSDNNEGPIAVYKDDVYLGAMAGQTFQLFDMERVEVLRGPQGTLYGRNATGGLVHFISKRPTEELSGNIDLTIAKYDQIKFEGAISGALTDAIQARLSVATNDHDGYVDNRIGKDANEADSWAYRLQLNFNINEDVSLLLNAHAGDSDTIAPKYSHEVVDPSGFDFWGYADNDSDPFEGDYGRDGTLEIETQGYNATLNWDLENMSLVSITAWEEMEKFHQEDTDMGPLPALEPTFAADYEQFSQEFRLSGEFERGNWTAGAYYFESDVEGDYALQVRYFGGLINFLDSLPAAAGGFEGGLGLVGAPFPDGDLLNFVDYDVNFQQDTESWAIFGQFEYELSDSLRLTFGIRYTDEEREFEYTNAIGPDGSVLTDFLLAVGAIDPANNFVFDFSKGGADVIAGNTNDIDNDNLSGKIGLDWDISNDVMMFATISRGFKSGGFNAGFMDGDMQAARDNFGVNVQYDEETLTSYEIGIKSIFADGRVRLNATAFYYDYEDFQALSFFGISQFLVNSDADVKGGEIELVAQPTDGLEFQLGASFIDSNVDEVLDLNTGQLLEDREMVLSPDFSMNGLARYEWDAFGGNMVVQADFNYQGDHFFDITNIDIAKEDSYTVWNARVAYKTSDEKWQIALFGKNLSDREYRVYTFNFTGAGGFNQQFFAPPRWYGLDLSYSF